MSSSSRLRRTVASLETYDCRIIEPESRDAVALAQILEGTLEEARTRQISWSDREIVSGWLQKNRRCIPTHCVGVCGQLETRLSFSFLPGLSWPGQGAIIPPSAGRSDGRSDDDHIKFRNLAGLSPPVGNNAAEAAAVAATAAASSTPSYLLNPETARSAGVGSGAVSGGGGGGIDGKMTQEDGNYSSTDDEAGPSAGLGAGTRDAYGSPGLGSPEILPSVLEQGTVDMNTLEEADNAFLLQPTPQGVKSYCIVQRTRSTIRTYFRLFLQEQRPLGDSTPPPPASISSGGGGANASGSINGNQSSSATGAASSASTGPVSTGGNSTAVASSSGGASGGMETLRAFLAVGGVGGGGGGSTAGPGGASGSIEEDGAAGGRFLLSSKRYRSTRSRSASYIWSKNGVWKDKHALAKVSTQLWGGTKGDGTMSSPVLVGDHARSLAASPGSSSSNAAAAAATAASAGFPTSSGTATVVAESPRDDGSDGKGRSPAFSMSSGGGGGGGGAGGGGGSRGGSSSEGSFCRRLEGGSPACWAMVINVQLEGEARLLSVTAIVPDPSAATAMAALGAAGGGSDQSVEAALAEGLRTWERTGSAPPGTMVLRSKQPKWSAWQGCHTLDFDRGDERVREPSRKNVSMISMDGTPGGQGGKGRGRGKDGAGSSNPSGGTGRGRRGMSEPRGDDTDLDGHHRSATVPILQVGKISDEYFSLDFSWPLSPLQAFVAAMAIFDG